MIYGDRCSPTELECLHFLERPNILKLMNSLELPIDYFLSFHSLKELRMLNSVLEMEPNAQFSPNAPLLHMLKVLD
jgi:hypothetical protein